jgi:hypothetical protein
MGPKSRARNQDGQIAFPSARTSNPDRRSQAQRQHDSQHFQNCGRNEVADNGFRIEELISMT